MNDLTARGEGSKNPASLTKEHRKEHRKEHQSASGGECTRIKRFDNGKQCIVFFIRWPEKSKGAAEKKVGLGGEQFCNSHTV